MKHNVPFFLSSRFVLRSAITLVTNRESHIPAHVLLQRPLLEYFEVMLEIKPLGLYDNAQNYSRAGLATDDNIAHAQCTLDT
jgi:hypothetical protein